MKKEQGNKDNPNTHDTHDTPNIQDVQGIQGIPDVPDIRELLPEELAGLMGELGEPAYRGGQLFSWLHKEALSDYQQMTNLSKPLRRLLEERFPPARPELLRLQESADGTKKYLFALTDGQRIESVLMRHREESGHIRHTVCLSSQAGCAMGCGFCATAVPGFRRNLRAGEIVGQLLEIAAVEQIEIHNAVYMGMGEPLLNEEAVKRSIRLLHQPLGRDMSYRRMTVSTCGIPEGILRMAEWDMDTVLAVSLHAADDETRSRLMPVNRRYPLRELLQACRAYQAKRGGRITFEYIMIKDINMAEGTAATLNALLKGILCHINLIPVNPGFHHFVCPDKREQAHFRQELQRAGLDAVIRQERGEDIQGACGQLAVC
ncbi:MAG: 23S rRNA (adenine(2503)-C(2))-methyltransferase RlmN [Clostridiales bacterium]|nr:23S rRNA (adenine(2503)-C(2))-methyltransferase RlmN [Clostridiales bacterium]